MNSLLIDLQYFPTVEYYLTLNKFSNVVFEQYDWHRKMSFRNRCVIAGANGPINLSVPLLGGRNQRIPAGDVTIENSLNWQAQHLRSIVSAYNRSPFFEHFSGSITTLFSPSYERLFEWNLACLKWINSEIGVKMNFRATETYESVPADAEVLDLRDWFFPRSINESVGQPVIYRQVFEERNGFIPNLSILDFLFCEGPWKLRELIAERKNS
ncbi:MAG: WbqC family protein [Flavitalea sp.]